MIFNFELKQNINKVKALSMPDNRSSDHLNLAYSTFSITLRFFKAGDKLLNFIDLQSFSCFSSLTGVLSHFCGSPSQFSFWTVTLVSTMSRCLKTFPHSADQLPQGPKVQFTEGQGHMVILESVSGDWVHV